MRDVKVTYKMYHDMRPNDTLVNGEKPKVLKGRDGDYFEAKEGMILTVSNERARYLVEERKLAEYVAIKKEKEVEVETAVNEPANIETADVVAKPKRKTTKRK